MSETVEKGKLLRLEDFIVLAHKGRNIYVDIKLREELVIRQVYGHEKIEKKEELRMRLLLADFTFRIEEKNFYVTKVYNFGSYLEKDDVKQFIDEALYDEAVKNIANHRLLVDYERLRKANIQLVPSYF